MNERYKMKKMSESKKSNLRLKCERVAFIIVLSILLGRIVSMLVFIFLQHNLFRVESLLLSLFFMMNYYLFNHIRFSFVRFMILVCLVAFSFRISWYKESADALTVSFCGKAFMGSSNYDDIDAINSFADHIEPISVTFFLLDAQNHLREPMRFSTQDLVETSVERYPDSGDTDSLNVDYRLKCVVNEETMQRIIAFTKDARTEDLYGTAIFSNGQTVLLPIKEPLEKNFFHLDFRNRPRARVERLSHSLMLTIRNKDQE